MASILKARSPSTATKDGPIAFNLQDVQLSADSYLAEVQSRAEEILCEAREMAREVQEKARKQGLEQAEQEFDERVQQAARKLTELRCRTAIASCESALERINETTVNWLTAWRDQTVSLAAHMAEKLVRQEISLDRRKTLSHWLEDALNSLRESRSIHICVHPDDHSIAEQLLELIARSIPQTSEARVVADSKVELGGCIVRTSHGQIDQQLTTQLERLVEQLS